MDSKDIRNKRLLSQGNSGNPREGQCGTPDAARSSRPTVSLVEESCKGGSDVLPTGTRTHHAIAEEHPTGPVPDGSPGAYPVDLSLSSSREPTPKEDTCSEMEIDEDKIYNKNKRKASSPAEESSVTDKTRIIDSDS